MRWLVRRSAGKCLLAALGCPWFSLIATPWSGLDPFSSPSPSTDYYGSGDLNLDVRLDDDDVTTLRDVAAGRSQANELADMDGDGDIDDADVGILIKDIAVLKQASRWETLSSSSARLDWLKRMLRLDPTDQHPYTTAWLQCVGFSTSLYLRFTGDDSDLHFTDFDSGQTRFNVPMYCVAIEKTGFGHGINAVLVGDDPGQFADWCFIEPQTDSFVAPGSASMPWDSRVAIYVPQQIQATGQARTEQVVFEVAATGAQRTYLNPDLRLLRPTNPRPRTRVEPFRWNPQIIPLGSGGLLLDRRRQDHGRPSDLHWRPLLSSDQETAIPASQNWQFRRLLDAYATASNEVEVLFRGDHQYVPTISVARLDPTSGRWSELPPVATGHSAWTGHVLRDDAGDTHVFWLEMKLNVDHRYPSGIYWSKSSGSSWTEPVRIVAVTNDVPVYVDSSKPDPRHYFFDVAKDPSGGLILVWARRTTPIAPAELWQTRSVDGWSSGTLIGQLTGATAGLDLCSDGAGHVHMVYWSGPLQTPQTEGRGEIFYRRYEKANWTDPTQLSRDALGFGASITANSNSVLAAWLGKPGDRSLPTFTRLDGTSWSEPAEIVGSNSGTAWYPKIALLEDGSALAAWSDRSGEGVSVATRGLPGPLRLLTRELPPAWVGVPYAIQLEAAGGTPPYRWVPSGLEAPASSGLSITPDGWLNFTANQAGAFLLSVAVTDQTDATVTQTYPLSSLPTSLVLSLSFPTPETGPTVMLLRLRSDYRGRVVLEASADLTLWNQVGDAQNFSGTLEWSLALERSQRSRFLRVRASRL